LDEALRLAHDFREACKALEGGIEDRSPRAALALGLEYLIQWYRDSLALHYQGASLRFASHRDTMSQLARRFSSVEHTRPADYHRRASCHLGQRECANRNRASVHPATACLASAERHCATVVPAARWAGD
jgi:hypothetical protein